MRSLISILIKNIVLLALLVVSIVFMFSNNIGYQQVTYIFGALGFLYVISACFEAYQLAYIKKGTHKYVYFTDGFISKRIIKIIALIGCGVFMYKSGNIIKYLSFTCFLISFTEVIVTAWRYFNRLCFVAFEGNTLIVSTNKLNTIFANQITSIETRHGITYFITQNLKAITLRTDMMKNKEPFESALKQWIVENKLDTIVAKG